MRRIMLQKGNGSLQLTELKFQCLLFITKTLQSSMGLIRVCCMDMVHMRYFYLELLWSSYFCVLSYKLLSIVTDLCRSIFQGIKVILVRSWFYLRNCPCSWGR